jgi:cytochrome c biogenesis protein CcdA
MSDSTTQLPKSIDSEKVEQIDAQTEVSNQKKSKLAVVIIVLILLGLIVGLFFLARADGQVVSQVRDIFIILMALMMVVIGAALVLLIIQLANLTNLLQHEIKPILHSTTDTVTR